jgi:hypothetical protein
MSEIPGNVCVVCGLPAVVHLTDVGDDGARDDFFCIDHVPVELRDLMPETPADEVALLREKLAQLDQSPMSSETKAQARADLEQLIGDIEAGRRRLSDRM